MISRRRFLAISAVAATVGALRFTRHKVQWSGIAMGADVSITLFGANEKLASSAIQNARGVITRVEALFSLYDPHSLISRLNGDNRLDAPKDFIELIKIADHANRITHGLFDPTVQATFVDKLNGKDWDNHAEPRTSWQQVHFNDKSVRFEQAGMAITLNGIAQGFATDKVRDALMEQGFGNTVVNIGEYWVGARPSNIGLTTADGEVFANETICDAAIATSAAGGFLLPDGSSHIINPLDNSPAQWASATVIASSAAIADALSTALILANGRELAQRVANDGHAQSIFLEDFSRNHLRIEKTA